jgi:beta-glucosidase
LGAKMGEAYIKGHQERDLKDRTKAAANLKHYIGYGVPFNGRDRTVAYIPDIELREFHLPAFAHGVAAGALTVMINSGDVNGIPGHSNGYYINDILKGELKFEGIVISDWQDIIRLHTRDKIADTPEEAVRIAVMAGIDMSMVPYDYSFTEHCLSLSAKYPNFTARVNDATMRILKVKEKLGIFDNPYPNRADLNKIGTQESHDFNLQAARESIVLAKNENNLLPLQDNQKVLVTGASGNSLRVLHGGWSYSWPGNNETTFQAFGRKKYTIYESVRAYSNDAKYVEGANFTHVINIEEAVREAQTVDVIILCIGEDTYIETGGNIGSLILPKSQLALADAILGLNKPTVIVYLGGRPRIMTNVAEKANAVLVGFLPGSRGGEAIADILFGRYKPALIRIN